MLFSCLSFLDNTLFFDENGNNAGIPNSEEESKGSKNEENGSKGGDETITLTKAEFEEKLKQKFAEGARKAQEGKLNNATDQDKKTNVEQNKGQSDQNLLEEVNKIKSELATYKALAYAADAGVKPEYKEDLVALIKGKGLEPTPENIKKEADKHPEWKYQTSTGNGNGNELLVKPLGGTGGQNNPPAADEKSQASKMFGL